MGYPTRSASTRAAQFRYSRIAVLAFLSIGLAACARVPGVYVVVNPSGTGAAAASIDGGNFDAQQYVASIWSSKVVPAFRTRAISAQMLISALTANPAQACTRYGNQPAQDSSCAFMVKGTGRITGVATSISGTTLTVELPSSAGAEHVQIDAGPAFTGTAVRDAIPFIKFAQYTNQVDYAEVGIELNAMVRKRVIGTATFAKARGQTVSFIGAAESGNPKDIEVTPVILSVGAP